jgi:hypothetical protein
MSAPTQTDASGRTWSFSGWSDGGAASHAVTTNTSPATYTATFTAAPLFKDGFESGGTSRWTFATGLVVQQQDVYAGRYAARATSDGSATYAYAQLPTSQPEVFDRFRFKVNSQGSDNVTLGKLRAGAGAGAPIVAFYRSGSGKLCLRNEVAGTSLCAVSPSLGVWHTLQVHARTGAGGLTEVWLDGTRLAALSQNQALGSAPVGRIQIGNNQAARTYDMLFDDVVVDTTRI